MNVIKGMFYFEGNFFLLFLFMYLWLCEFFLFSDIYVVVIKLDWCNFVFVEELLGIKGWMLISWRNKVVL